MSDSHECPTCKIIGLPILPLRYALAWAGDDVVEGKRAPDLGLPFDVSDYPPLGTDNAKYTLRLLRGGYLYVYDEARRQWSAYEVAPGGQLYAFDMAEGPVLGASAQDVVCSRSGARSLARCIQVKDAAKAGKLWLVHSDTQWTTDVLKRHEESEYRALHMRCIDVGAWFRAKGRKTQKHLALLEGVFDSVSEYALKASPKSYFNAGNADGAGKTAGTASISGVTVTPEPAFMFSPYDFAALDRSDFSGVLWGETPNQPVSRDPYAMVALGDPVGLTAEVGALMNDRLAGFLAEPGRARPLAASAAIQQLRETVEHQTVLKSVNTTDAVSSDIGSYADARGGMGAGDLVRENVDLDANDLKKIRANAWASSGYLERYNEAARESWQAQHDSELRVIDETIIAPLARVHVILLESTKLRVHLQCNYDPDDALSGAGYLGVVLSCIVDTQDKLPQAELYGRWLESSPQDKNNLLLRAYLLNQDRLAEQVARSAESAVKIGWSELQWSNLFGLYGEAVKPGGDGVNTLVATLIKQTMGPFAKVLGRVVDAPTKLYGLVAWGVAGKVPLEKVTLASKTSGQIVREVMLAMERATGQRPRYQAIHAELRRLQILGLNTRQSRSDIAFVGVRQDSTLVSSANYRMERNGFIGNKLGNWRSVIDTDLRTGLAGSLLSAVALATVYKKAVGSMMHERDESWARVVFTSVGVVGGSLELAGKQVERVGNAVPRFMRWSAIGTIVANLGRAFSAIGGILISVVDFTRAWREKQRGNEKMATLYFISGAAGLGLSVAILAGSLLFSVFFLVALVVVTLIIMIDGDNSKHAWLERCYWGRLESERYEDDVTESREYQLAIGVS